MKKLNPTQNIHALFGIGKFINSEDLKSALIDSAIERACYFGWKNHFISSDELEKVIEVLPEMPPEAEWHWDVKNYQAFTEDGTPFYFPVEQTGLKVVCRECGYKEDFSRMKNFCPQCGRKIRPVLMRGSTKTRLLEKYRPEKAPKYA